MAAGPKIATALREQGIEAHSNTDVVALVNSGNIQAIHAVRQAGRDLGEVLAASVSLLNPSLIVVGGRISAAGEHLLAGIREVVYQRGAPLSTQHLQNPHLSQLGGRSPARGEHDRHQPGPEPGGNRAQRTCPDLRQLGAGRIPEFNRF